MIAAPPAPDDAKALLARIGAIVHAEPLPGPANLVEIGLRGQLPCWWAAQPPHAAVATARKLARQGTLGLLIADAPGGGRRTLIATVPPVRAAVVSPDAQDASAITRLAQLRCDPSLLGQALAVAAAIDVDAAGRRAFRALRSGIESAVAALPARIPPGARRDWVLLQVTRLLFLRFVETEGWLDANRSFLADAFDECLASRRQVEPHLLAPLFFGTLNRPLGSRSRRARAFGAIPFLNGGLFEPHPIERSRDWSLPTDAWQTLFALLVDSFEVTLDRGEVGERVNPELLGRVFEGVMAPDARKSAGAYYTPPALVDAVVREAFASHLARLLGRDETTVRNGLDDPDPRLLTALQSLVVLDPAVGSGAFLVGALHLMSGPRPDAATVRTVITRRLFGVDKDPAAVRHAELRLWLEVLRAMRGRSPMQVSPLPNLDTTVRAGNALLDPFSGGRLSRPVSVKLERARRAVVQSHGADRRTALGQLRQAERKAAQMLLVDRMIVLRARLDDLQDRGRSADLFGNRIRMPVDVRRAVAELRRELSQLMQQHKRLADGNDVAAFGIETAFAATLAAGGFDLVIGNPPWVRSERLPGRERAALKGRYRWWRGGGTGGWRHPPDLSVAFIERATELLKPGGTLALLVPSKLATVDYAASCRAALSHHHTLHAVADLDRDPRADFAATTYPLALVASRGVAATGHRIRMQLGAGREVDQSAWREAGIWPLGDGVLQSLAERLAKEDSLANRYPPSLGVKTGANELFLDPPVELDQFTRWAVRGRDVRPLAALPSARLLWPADDKGIPLSRLPAPLREHLQRHQVRLEHRSDYAGGPWWRIYRTETATARWRVIWPDLAPRLRAAPLPDQAQVPVNSCYVIAVESQQRMYALAAWLNAAPVRALARLGAEPAANGYARFRARAVGRIPLPSAAIDCPVLAGLGGESWSADVAARIDKVASDLLALTTTEREAVGAFIAAGG